ncbi:MAG: DUF4358 domain-containing protein [Pseudoflavonifractor sp.]
MKKFASLALTLAMGASLAAPALAADQAVIAPNPNAAPAYATTIVLNGKTLDTSKLPASEGIPMRLLSESDYGNVNWFAEENSAYFTFENANVNVDFKTGAVEIAGEVLKDITAEVKEGVTFLPLSVLKGIEGYKVEEKDNNLTITTPNADPTVKLCREIVTAGDLAANRRTPEAELYEYMGFKKENYAAVTAFASMMNVRVDIVMVAKPAAGKMDAVKADMKAYQDKKIKEFEHYLVDQLEVAKAGKIVEKNGYVMLLLAPDTAKGIELFNAFAEAQK